MEHEAKDWEINQHLYLQDDAGNFVKNKDGTYSQQPRNADKVFEDNKRVLIVGESGTGKSHLLRKEMHALMRPYTLQSYLMFLKTFGIKAIKSHHPDRPISCKRRMETPNPGRRTPRE